MALLEHNLKVYNEAVDYFKNGGRDLLITQDTGTGKSYICVELLKTIFKGMRVLYVVPKWSIAENFKDTEGFNEVEENIEFTTYNSFTNIDVVNEYLEKYGVFVFDEAHHLGSDLYGNFAKDLVNIVKSRNDKYVIGMTATPVREDKQDVSDYFSKRIQGVSLFECIQAGLINPFDYIICSSAFVEKYKELVTRNVIKIDGDLKKYKYDFTNSETLLESIIKENPRDKWIVYFHSLEKLQENRQMLQKVFQGYDIVEIHSYSDEDTTLKDIKKMKRVVVLSIDILLEGVHIPGIEGIILFRNVSSLLVFKQILGRVTSMNKKYMPIVIDCTSVASRMLYKLNSFSKEGGNGVRTSYSPSKGLDIFNVRLDNKEYFDIMEFIEASSRKILVNGKFYESVSHFCRENGFTKESLRRFGLTLNGDLPKEELCRLYLEHVNSKRLEFNNKVYVGRTRFKTLAEDMGWDSNHFGRFREKRRGQYNRQGISYTDETFCKDYLEYLQNDDEENVCKFENQKKYNKWVTSRYIEKKLSDVGFPTSRGFLNYIKKKEINKNLVMRDFIYCKEVLSEYIKEKAIIYNGKYYVTQKSLCKDLGISSSTIYAFSKREGIEGLNYADQVNMYLTKIHEYISKYPFLNSKYSSVSDFCKQNKLSYRSFTEWCARQGRTYENEVEVLEEYNKYLAESRYKSNKNLKSQHN